MKFVLALFFQFAFFYFTIFAQTSIKSLVETNKTPTYQEMVLFYKQISEKNDKISLYNMGKSDEGSPIYLCILNAEKDSLLSFDKARNNTTLLINNGIHPGEPCGINAAMALTLQYHQMDENQQNEFPVVAIITSYNIGGMLNRSAYSRANQVGPEAYGFRGNARNLDLNRDFIKSDSKNMFTFAKIFHGLDPDFMIDTHTTNGADYQYPMTYIANLRERMHPSLAKILHDDFLPKIHNDLWKKYNYHISPYVSKLGKTLDEGIHLFNATPRYAQGYGELFNTITITTEAHMLKPFETRVKTTLDFINETILFLMDNKEQIEQARKTADQDYSKQEYYKFNYEKSPIYDSILFHGFEWEHIDSKITKQKRLRYDTNRKFERHIPFAQNYIPQDSVKIPKYFLVQAQEEEIIQRLKSNGIIFHVLKQDLSNRDVEALFIEDFKSSTKPYEGHYFHHELKLKTEPIKINFNIGDILIPLAQKNINYIMAALYPKSEDSFFRWGFFDSYLQQKEYFSDYIFEEIALEILENDDKIRAEFNEALKLEDFANNRWEQIFFLYKRSPYYEPTAHRLPVFMVDDVEIH